MSKHFSAILLGILLLSLFFIDVSAAELSRPTVPEFTVRVYDSSSDKPASTTIDPYNGQTVIQPGVHIEARSIEIRIKNPYPAIGPNDYPADFSYNIRWKGHFEQDQYWRVVYGPKEGFLEPNSTASETVYRVVAHPHIDEIELTTWSCYVSADAQIDIQVEAFIGGYAGDPFLGWNFTGESSGWSNTQTFTLNFNDAAPTYQPTSSPSNQDTPNSQTTPSSTGGLPTSQATPVQPNLNISIDLELNDFAILVLAVVLVVVLAFTVIYVRRPKGR